MEHMEQLQGTLSHLMVEFQSRMSSFEAELQKAPNPSATASGLATEFATFKSFILDTLNSLQSQIHILAKSLDKLEMHSRRKILLLHGVQELEGEDPSQIAVKTVSERLMSEFALQHIKRCHRMGRVNNSSRPRPIIIKFHDKVIRDKIWFSKSRLKGTGTTLSEFLTHSRHNTFMAARERFGVNKCWTQEGTIHVLGINNTRHRITTIAELQSLEPEPAKPAAATKLAPKARRVITGKK
ncbi:unnamed protein product [Diatraea saccharalis]|uniref:Uncharacterized protein n=1 Tax=Diatraea saccharalis TaxID=40085 RepID=A0A9N9R699_9NEOP|nr:unnamed protein product [Diatraea saccharalis]